MSLVLFFNAKSVVELKSKNVSQVLWISLPYYNCRQFKCTAILTCYCNHAGVFSQVVAMMLMSFQLTFNVLVTKSEVKNSLTETHVITRNKPQHLHALRWHHRGCAFTQHCIIRMKTGSAVHDGWCQHWMFVHLIFKNLSNLRSWFQHGIL